MRQFLCFILLLLVLEIVHYNLAFQINSGIHLFSFTRRRFIPLQQRKALEVNDIEKNTLSKTSARKQLERLINDKGDRLIHWIKTNGGVFHGAIIPNTEGWKVYPSAQLPHKIPRYTELMRIPKSICLFSNPKDMRIHFYHEYLIKLLSAIDEEQWRTRFALILLSERVNRETKFSPYIGALPFEIWGIPIFFATTEIPFLQDLKLKMDTTFRCKFLTEFAEKLFPPLYRSIVPNNPKNNPFHNRSPDVNSFGWGFSCASSRALQLQQIVEITSEEESATTKRKDVSVAVLIPGMDLLSHSVDPNCIIMSDPKTDSYILYNSREISTQDELTISYGPFSNLELFANYGFSIYPNPHEQFSFTANQSMINLARVIMGQTTNWNIFHESRTFKQRTYRKRYTEPMLSEQYIGIGLNYNLFCDQNLHQWQNYWLKALQLDCPSSRSEVPPLSITDNPFTFELSTEPLSLNLQKDSYSSIIDKRLLAMLRILYSNREQELIEQGYDPLLLGERGSLLSNPIQEAHVIKTLIGILLLVLKNFETHINTDLLLLQTNQVIVSQDFPITSYFMEKSPEMKVRPNIAVEGLLDTTTEEEEEDEKLELHYDIQRCHELLQEVLVLRHQLRNPLSEEDSAINKSDDETKETTGTSTNSSDVTNQPITFQTLQLQRSNNLSIDTVLQQLGQALPINIRESYRYRIRKKLFLYDTLTQLIDDYEFLQSQVETLPNLEEIRQRYQKKILKVKERADITIKAKKLQQEQHIKDILFVSSPESNHEMIEMIMNDPILKSSRELSQQWSDIEVDL